MPKILPLGDQTEYILKGMIASRGTSQTKLAKLIHMPSTTLMYQIRHAEDLKLSTFRHLVKQLGLSDAEIVRVVRERKE